MKEKLQAKSAEEAKEETTVRKTAKTTAPKDKAVTAEPPAKESTADVTQPASKLYVAIHQLKDGHDWHFDSWEEASKTHTAKNPLDFKAYEQKWQETYEAKGENVSQCPEV